MSPDDAFTMEEKFKKVGISTRETDSGLSDAISSLSSASIFKKNYIILWECVKFKNYTSCREVWVDFWFLLTFIVR